MTNPPNTPPDKPDPALAHLLRNHRAAGEPSFDVDAAWTRFEERQGLQRVVVATISKSRRPVFLAVAGAALAAALVIVAVRLHSSSTSNRPVDMVQVVAADGRPQLVTLDDGSRITLHGGSTLRYPSRGGDRDVYLDGEALFEITHDPRRAFRVHAAQGIVRDIGTKFTVRAYPNERSVQVAVTDGRVSLAIDLVGAGAPVDLAAGDAALLDSAGAISKLPPAATERLLAWTTGAMIFENVPLSLAAAEIQRRYGVQIAIADSTLARRPVVARFHGEPVRQVLDAIVLALGAHYDVTGPTYTLRPGRR